MPCARKGYDLENKVNKINELRRIPFARAFLLEAPHKVPVRNFGGWVGKIRRLRKLWRKEGSGGFRYLQTSALPRALTAARRDAFVAVLVKCGGLAAVCAGDQ